MEDRGVNHYEECPDCGHIIVRSVKEWEKISAKYFDGDLDFCCVKLICGPESCAGHVKNAGLSAREFQIKLVALLGEPPF